jgi:hypothetical protein
MAPAPINAPLTIRNAQSTGLILIFSVFAHIFTCFFLVIDSEAIIRDLR